MGANVLRLADGGSSWAGLCCVGFGLGVGKGEGEKIGHKDRGIMGWKVWKERRYGGKEE